MPKGAGQAGSLSLIAVVVPGWNSRTRHEWFIHAEKNSAKRHFKASHWDLSKLTHFNGYFDENNSGYPLHNTRVEMCQFSMNPIVMSGHIGDIK